MVGLVILIQPQVTNLVDEEMNKHQLRKLIAETLKEVDLYSHEATELLMLTAAVESQGGEYIEQIRGPANGIFQMEPATELDIWKNYLAYKPHLKDKAEKFLLGTIEDEEEVWNLKYAIIMARLHYLRVPKPLPRSILGMAEYWKSYYNTYEGKGSVDKAIEAYETYAL